MNLQLDILKHIFYYDYNTSYLIKHKIQKPIYEDYEFLITYYIVFENSVFPDYLKPYICYKNIDMNDDTICLCGYTLYDSIESYKNIKIFNKICIDAYECVYEELIYNIKNMPKIIINLELDFLYGKHITSKCLKNLKKLEYLSIFDSNIKMKDVKHMNIKHIDFKK